MVSKKTSELPVEEANVSVNSKRDHPPRATPGHLSPVQLHIEGHLTRIEARPIGHLTPRKNAGRRSRVKRIFVLHVTSHNSSGFSTKLLVCKWRHGSHVGGSKTKEFLSAGKWTLFWCKFKISFVLTTNMAALSRGCKRRIYVDICDLQRITVFGKMPLLPVFTVTPSKNPQK